MAVHRRLDASLARAALDRLDQSLRAPAHLILGGGAAMVLAYDFRLATRGMDVFAGRGSPSLAEWDEVIKKIARELDLEPDWLNPDFEAFTHVLSPDYVVRLRNVFRGKHLRVDALGPEDLLLLKCFAGRDRDRMHARALIRLATDLDRVGERLSDLIRKRVPGAARARDYFDDLRDEAGL